MKQKRINSSSKYRKRVRPKTTLWKTFRFTSYVTSRSSVQHATAAAVAEGTVPSDAKFFNLESSPGRYRNNILITFATYFLFFFFFSPFSFHTIADSVSLIPTQSTWKNFIHICLAYTCIGLPFFLLLVHHVLPHPTSTAASATPPPPYSLPLLPPPLVLLPPPLPLPPPASTTSIHQHHHDHHHQFLLPVVLPLLLLLPPPPWDGNCSTLSGKNSIDLTSIQYGHTMLS